MDKQLKTMTVNQLLEELGACNSEASLLRLEKVANDEMQEQDSVTREMIYKLVHYKKFLLLGNDENFTRLVRKNKRLLDVNKKDFYRYVTAALSGLDFSLILQAVQAYRHALPKDDKSSQANADNTMLLMVQLEEKYLNHLEEEKTLRPKLKEELLASYAIQ